MIAGDSFAVTLVPADRFDELAAEEVYPGSSPECAVVPSHSGREQVSEVSRRQGQQQQRGFGERMSDAFRFVSAELKMNRSFQEACVEASEPRDARQARVR